jgi:hypothetical protein
VSSLHAVSILAVALAAVGGCSSTTTGGDGDGGTSGGTSGTSGGTGSCAGVTTPQGPAKGSCAVGATFCIDYTGSGYTPTSVASGCMQAKGTYSASACPTGDVLGACITSCKTTTESVTYYSVTSGLNAETAEQACKTSNASWVPK